MYQGIYNHCFQYRANIFLSYYSEFDDFILPQEYIQFENGSRRGQKSCAIISIIDDNVAEEFEEFVIHIVSTDEAVGIIEGESTVTISIEDNDGVLLVILIHIN